jgi:hypothetical protein
MNKLKKLFGPKALAATLSTAMLLHAALAWADGNCLSRPVSNGTGCDSGYPTQCSAEVIGNIYGDQNCDYLPWQTYYWCCPSGETCGQLGGASGPPPQCWGWCQCN